MPLFLLLRKQSEKKYRDAAKWIFGLKALILALSAFNEKKEGFRVWWLVITGGAQGGDGTLVGVIPFSPGSRRYRVELGAVCSVSCHGSVTYLRLAYSSVGP